MWNGAAIVAVLGGILSESPHLLRERPAVGALDDEEIARRVSSELALDEALAARRVDVEVEQGVVTLRGSLPSLSAKNRAGEVAELVRGARAVVNLIEVEAKDVADPVLAEAVTRAIAEASYPVSPGGIGIAATDGLVLLTGSVPSLRDRIRIERLVEDTRGARGIDNRLSVRDADEQHTDEEVKAAIERLLAWDAQLDAAEVEVDIVDGAARLSGTVGSAAEKSRAVRLAGIPGVVSVDGSALRVEPHSERIGRGAPGELGEEEVERAVEDALFYDPRVRSFEIEADVRDGIAVLRGEVPSLEAKLAAERDAESVVGVLGVENELLVRPARNTSWTDDDLENAVSLALDVDPFLEGDDVVVTVDEGVVRLHGTLESGLRKERAGEVASVVPGAVRVENDIEVVRLESMARLSDEEIREAVEQQIRTSSLVDSDEVTVHVEDGMATLTGVVESLSARRAASREAFQGGAVLVKNELRVRGMSGERSR